MKLRFSLCVAFALLHVMPILAADSPKKVLVVTVTTGFRHSCIPTSEKILAELAATSGKFTVEFVQQPDGEPKAPSRPRPGPKGADDPAHQEAMKKFAEEEKAYRAAFAQWQPAAARALEKLSAENLRRYDAVLFASTTGELPLPDKQALLDWIASGKAFIGVHAATDTLKEFAPYIEMIGGQFLTHGPQVSVDCLAEDPAHAACAALPSPWTIFDEIYEFSRYERAKVHGLLALDKHPQKKSPGHFPIAWCKEYGRGRVFYTALGHREDVWDPAYKDGKGERRNSPEVARQFQQHVLGGILWALGLAPGDATPPGAAK